MRNPNLVHFCMIFGSQLCGPFFKEAFPDTLDSVRIFLFYIIGELPTLPSFIILKSEFYT